MSPDELKRLRELSERWRGFNTELSDQCADELEVLVRATAPSVVEPAWQPMNTVPKDGRWIWMARARTPNPEPKRITVSAFKWDDSHQGWFSGTGWWHRVDELFTHWMSMTHDAPAPPAVEGQEP